MLVLTAVCCWLLYPLKNFKPYSDMQNESTFLTVAPCHLVVMTVFYLCSSCKYNVSGDNDAIGKS